MSERDSVLYLDDIREATDKILDYTQNVSRKEFESNPMRIDAVIRNLGIIGEAARHLSEEEKRRFRDVPWREIIGMRNVVIHEYFGVNKDILWQTVTVDIPKLRSLLTETTA